MRIAFDFNPVLVNRFSGLYSYGAGLLAGFEELGEKEEFLLFYSKRFSTQAKAIKENLGDWAELKGTFIKMRHLENLWRWSDFPRLEYFTGPFDLYHCCHHLMPPTKDKPRLLTVHDLRRYKLPQLYKESKLDLFEAAVKKADHFIAISQSTKQDLCSVFKVNENKVDVVPLASQIESVFYSDAEKSIKKTELSEKIGQRIEEFFVVFSSPDSRKNIPKIVEAFEIAQKSLPKTLKLLVIGRLPKREADFAERLRAGSFPNIIWAGIVDDLRPWLACAKAFIFASLYEGFGIPILEAFGCGVPVIASDCSSMPEVAGVAALYVDPYNTESISDAMVRICSDIEMREKLISLGLNRVREFSWKKTAAKTLDVYRKFL